MQTQQDTPILNVENLAISYKIRDGMVPAVRDVSFKIHRGEAHGIVGESGCGKSTPNGYVQMNLRASLIIPPQSGVGGGSPSPRKPSVPIEKIA